MTQRTIASSTRGQLGALCPVIYCHIYLDVDVYIYRARSIYDHNYARHIVIDIVAAFRRTPLVHVPVHVTHSPLPCTCFFVVRVHKFEIRHILCIGVSLVHAHNAHGHGVDASAPAPAPAPAHACRRH